MSKTTANKDDSITRSAANFLLNLDDIKHAIDLHARETEVVAKANKRLARVVMPRLEQTRQKVGASPITKASADWLFADINWIGRETNRFNKTVSVSLARQATARMWLTVMLVTCVEAYLQDLLARPHVLIDASWATRSPLCPTTKLRRQAVSKSWLKEFAVCGRVDGLTKVGPATGSTA
jgi:hypothetical protein